MGAVCGGTVACFDEKRQRTRAYQRLDLRVASCAADIARSRGTKRSLARRGKAMLLFIPSSAYIGLMKLKEWHLHASNQYHVDFANLENNVSHMNVGSYA